MADTDAAGVIYYACVFRWHEAAMMEWLDVAGQPIGKLLADGFAFPCVHSEADYLHPLRVDDQLDIRLGTGRVGTKSFELVSEGSLGEQTAVRVRAVYVWAHLATPRNPQFRPAALPAWLVSALEVNVGQR